jgi:hypothetical protein
MKSLILVFTLITFIFIQITLAQIPQTMSYQGMLTDSEGQMVNDGTYSMTFKLYDQATDGNMLWEESQNVGILNGIFDVTLGESNPLNLNFNQSYWLGITIAGEDELTPRIELTASPYSLNARQVKDTNIIPANGHVGIGITIPLGLLHLKDFDLGLQPEHLLNERIIVESPDAGLGLYSNKMGTYGSVISMGEVISGSLTNKWSLYRTTSTAIRPNQLEISFGSDASYAVNPVFWSLSANGGMGVGTSTPTERLEVAGTVYSTAGGFKFPDGSVQTTAAGGSGGNGDITSVHAGNGLTGGATTGDATLDVGAGTGINVSADAVTLNTTYTDGRYVNEGQAGSISAGMITPNVVSSVDGVSNDGGNIDLIAGSNVTITPNDANNTITLSSAGGTGGGDITAVTAGAGLTGGGSTADVNLDVGAGTGISVLADAVALNTTYSDNRYVNEGQAGSISAGMITPNVVSSVDGVSNDGGNIDLIAGSNVTITSNDANNTITISSSGGTGGGDITAVTAGAGLTGGGTTADVNLDIGAGTGINVSADAVALNTTYTDGRYVNEGQAGSISAAMITPNVLSSVDGVSNDGGNVDLIAGDNVTITSNDANNTITISATDGAGDNLGNHTATQNLNMNGFWISGNGEDNGIYINETGVVDINRSVMIDYEFGNHRVELSTASFGVEARTGTAFIGSLVDETQSAGVYGSHYNGHHGKLGAESFGVYGEHNNGNNGFLGGDAYGVLGKGYSTDTDQGIGVQGEHNNGNYGFMGGYFQAVYGRFYNGNYGYLGDGGFGVYGRNNNRNMGYLGGIYYGTYGRYGDDGNYGYLGSEDYGAYGEHSSNNYGYLGGVEYAVYGSVLNGNYGYLAGSGYGVYGFNDANDNRGYIAGQEYSIYGQFGNNGPYGFIGGFGHGVYGHYNDNTGYLGSANYGAYGENDNGNFGYLGGEDNAIAGYAAGNADYECGVRGQVDGSNSYGVFGVSNGTSGGRGVHGHAVSSTGTGVYGWNTYYNIYGYLGGYTNAVYGYNANTAQYAGYFAGNVRCTETLYKTSGAFKIDHPLDPANKYLNHSFVESPDMMNIYNGNVTLDSNGEAVVEMPEWFEALNRDFSYQLTCISGFAPVYIEEEITNNRFMIAGGNPGMKVSWQITGIRQDAYANAHRIPVEEDKVGEEVGKYQNPTEHGVSETLGIGYEEELKMEAEQSRLEEDNIRIQEQLSEEGRKRIDEIQRFEQERIRMDEQRQAEQERRAKQIEH